MKIVVVASGRGYRRVVVSPKPLDIIEKDAIKTLSNTGFLVIAVGGGGIPVVKEENGFRGVESVIDKDYASSLLAREIEAVIGKTGTRIIPDLKNPLSY